MWYYICHIQPKKSLNIKITLQQKEKKKFDSSRVADAFCYSNATHEQIGAAGLKIFVILYDGKDIDKLPSLIYAKHMKMTSITSSVKPKKLSSTERAAYFNPLSIFYQVQEKLSMQRQFKCSQLGMEILWRNIKTSLDRQSTCPRWDT